MSTGDDYHIGNVFVPPFHAPALASLEDELSRLGQVERRIEEIDGISPLFAIDAVWDPRRQDIRSKIEGLQHSLSPYLHFMDGGVKKSRTSVTEVGIARDVSELTSEGLIGAMHEAIKKLSVKRTGLRKIQVGTNTDRFGNRGIYPPPETLQALIEELDDAVRMCTPRSPLLAAIFAFCGINAIHPFEDGNGRTARVLFNSIMMRHIPGCFYLPIIEIWEISKGGLLIKLRDALYNNNWSDIIDHFCISYDIFLNCFTANKRTSN